MRRKILIFVLIILILAIGSFVWFFIKRNWLNSQNNIIPDQVQVSKEPIEAASSTNITQTATSSIQESQTSTSSLKTYRNEEYGFEFQYPESWSFFSNTFYGPFSKLNLVGASPEENGRPNPLSSSILINIVTSDFAYNAAKSVINLNLKSSPTLIAQFLT
jgi:hypothetical protein